MEFAALHGELYRRYGSTDLYDAFGITLDSDDAHIRSKFREKTSKYHPDRNRATDSEQKQKDVNAIYEILGDHEKRAQYDEWLNKHRRQTTSQYSGAPEGQTQQYQTVSRQAEPSYTSAREPSQTYAHPQRSRAIRRAMVSLWGDEFAVRFRENDLRRWYNREITIQEGSLDLLILDGRLDRVLSGNYKLNDLLNTKLHRSPKKEVVRVRSREVELDFSFIDLPTADSMLVDLECYVAVQLQRGAEQLFYANLMQENERIVLLDLRAHTFPSLRYAAETWSKQQTLGRFITNPADFNLTAEEALNQHLTRKGLVLRVYNSRIYRNH
jgi:curved DNA-binding protein CbpA